VPNLNFNGGQLIEQAKQFRCLRRIISEDEYNEKETSRIGLAKQISTDRQKA